LAWPVLEPVRDGSTTVERDDGSHLVVATDVNVGRQSVLDGERLDVRFIDTDLAEVGHYWRRCDDMGGTLRFETLWATDGEYVWGRRVPDRWRCHCPEIASAVDITTRRRDCLHDAAEILSCSAHVVDEVHAEESSPTSTSPTLPGSASM
jgi:hypothetical protein